jgi:hypothetical protein
MLGSRRRFSLGLKADSGSAQRRISGSSARRRARPGSS